MFVIFIIIISIDKIIDVKAAINITEANTVASTQPQAQAPTPTQTQTQAPTQTQTQSPTQTQTQSPTQTQTQSPTQTQTQSPTQTQTQSPTQTQTQSPTQTQTQSPTQTQTQSPTQTQTQSPTQTQTQSPTQTQTQSPTQTQTQSITISPSRINKQTDNYDSIVITGYNTHFSQDRTHLQILYYGIEDAIGGSKLNVLSPTKAELLNFGGGRSTGEYQITLSTDGESQNTTLLIVTNLPTGAIRGTVVDANNKPVANATIEVILNNSTMRTSTNQNGQFEMGDLPVGSLTIFAQGNSAQGETIVQVNENSLGSCTIQLR
ncbi:carboxypeptidase-like regulatory domain-containing protein [Desulfosporosinus acididurans]|nr:carboxypeptidase-like regulatory domain-containing protein [Desulfosporosinus acididurans]